MAAGAGRNKKLLPYKGEMLTLDELALLSPGVSRTRILKRIGDGWSIDDAVETPLDTRFGGRIKQDNTLPDAYSDSDQAEQQRLLAVNTIAQQINAMATGTNAGTTKTAGAGCMTALAIRSTST